MKIIFLFIGFISLGLGIIGIPLPLLPTTPFFLLSALCFAKGSDRVNDWFKSTTMYEHYVKSYFERDGMTKKRKQALLFTVTLIFVTALYIINNLYIKIFMILVLLAHYYHFIFKVKTVK